MAVGLRIAVWLQPCIKLTVQLAAWTLKFNTLQVFNLPEMLTATFGFKVYKAKFFPPIMSLAVVKLYHREIRHGKS